MRQTRTLVLGSLVGVLCLASSGSAQAPKQAPPIATLNQLMRGILYPNSNIIFDVQRTAPKDDAGVIYGGWAQVENGALALGEVANLLVLPGRKCENGKDVPIQRDDWPKYVEALRVAALATYKAAQSKNQEAVSDSTSGLSETCENCHLTYRDKPTMEARCIP